ncbi:MAG: glycosyltransferase family 2 protein [Candidatus Nealsonbacteria bacterium]
MNNLPFVSIIIPSRNEEKHIRKCLDSVISNDYPKSNFEILIVDGLSQDNTRKIIKEYQNKYPFIKFFDNLKKFTCFAWNIGINNSKGEIIVLMSAHAVYDKNYISKSVKYLKKYNLDNVGGIRKTISENNIVSKAISFSLSHIFGAGNSYFKTGFKKPRSVDTVFGGCYKKEIFKKIGLFNENLFRSQDMEFNLRLKKNKGKIFLFPDIISYYYPKDNLKDFLIHNFKNGVWAIYPLKFVKTPLRLRHYIPLFFVLSLLSTIILGIFYSIFSWIFLFIIGLYFLATIYFSIEIVLKEKNIIFFLLTPLVFSIRHVGYGLGSIYGLIKIFF